MTDGGLPLTTALCAVLLKKQQRYMKQKNYSLEKKLFLKICFSPLAHNSPGKYSAAPKCPAPKSHRLLWDPPKTLF